MAALMGCRQAPADSPPAIANPAGKPNVLLVTIDTLRADHLGAYGYAAASTPTLDALAHQGVRFETAVAHVPLTGPSHVSILTGHTPLGHGYHNNGGFVLAPGLKTAAGEYRQAGYRTAAFVSGYPLDRRFGFDRGFDVYDDHLPRGNDPRRQAYVERFGDATTDAALKWLSSAAGGTATPQPWFMWLHYYDPHAPYEPPGDLAERFKAAPYDGEIAFVDQQLARVLEGIDKNGARSRTLVLVTADHGESLGEHGEVTHGVFIYEGTLRVPWIMAGPGISRGRVPKTVARSIDILPTLLDYSGLPSPAGLEGRSLRPAADGREMEDAPSYAESFYTQLELGWAPLYGWRTATHKFIDAPHAELYDLAQDASEKTNLIAQQGALADQMRRGLQSAVRKAVPASAVAETDAESAARLRSLGYVSGSPGATQSGPLRDPKDGIKFMPRLNRAMSATRVQPELAIKDLTSVIEEDPSILMARRTRAVAYAAAGRHDLAIADIRELEKITELTPDDEIMLGDNLRFTGQYSEAARILERAVQGSPKSAQPLISLAEVLIAEKQYEAAAATLDRALKLAPDQIEALRRLGDLALLRSDMDAAGARYARILELDATDVPAMTKLGVVRMRGGRTEDAIRLFRDAVQRDPKNGDALLYMAGAMVSTGRQQEALPYFERAIAADPKSTMALNGLGLTRLSLGDKAGAGTVLRQSLRIDPSQKEIAQALTGIGR
jgi:arylsulfatase A-like enzyme/Tfp pilus assembly protein PilF